VFKHSNKTSSSDSKIIATEIYDKYLREGSDLYIDFPSRLLNNFNQSYLKTNKAIYNTAFDDLGDYVYSTLHTYDFPSFKNSPEYRELEKNLERDEINLNFSSEYRDIKSHVDGINEFSSFSKINRKEFSTFSVYS